MPSFYFMKNVEPLLDDPREPHRIERGSAGEEASDGDLAACAVDIAQIPMEEGWYRALQSTISKYETFKNQDIVKISPEFMPEYSKKLEIFFEEHLHTDPEVRFILDGSGYFDVRSADDRWIRIPVSRGSFVYLPAGLYHRFTPDTKDYIVALRLFTDEPKWEAHNRCENGTDDMAARAEYLKNIKIASQYVLEESSEHQCTDTNVEIYIEY